jgi:hypothetical protein
LILPEALLFMLLLALLRLLRYFMLVPELTKTQHQTAFHWLPSAAGFCGLAGTVLTPEARLRLMELQPLPF